MTLVNFIECFMPRAVNSVGYSVINYFRSFLLSRFLFLSVETKMVLSCWAWWWRRKYPRAIFTLESQKSLELWKWAERNEDIRNWREEGVPNFANFSKHVFKLMLKARSLIGQNTSGYILVSWKCDLVSFDHVIKSFGGWPGSMVFLRIIIYGSRDFWQCSHFIMMVTHLSQFV